MMASSSVIAITSFRKSCSCGPTLRSTTLSRSFASTKKSRASRPSSVRRRQPRPRRHHSRRLPRRRSPLRAVPVRNKRINPLVRQIANRTKSNSSSRRKSRSRKPLNVGGVGTPHHTRVRILPRRPQKCAKCHKRGHYARACHSTQAQAVRELNQSCISGVLYGYSAAISLGKSSLCSSERSGVAKPYSLSGFPPEKESNLFSMYVKARLKIVSV